MFQILQFYGVSTDVISQIFKQLYYFMCASSLNNLLLRKELCNWSKGYQIRHNLSHLEMWTREKNLDVSIGQSVVNRAENGDLIKILLVERAEQRYWYRFSNGDIVRN